MALSLHSTTLTPLTADEFRRRHRGLVLFLAAHAVALPLFALVEDWPLGTALIPIPLVLAFVALASLPRIPRIGRASATVLGLLCCSAALVWFWHGHIEAHFHYFVVVGAVALYEAWLPYAMAFTFVVLQHGAMSAMAPHHVFNHEGAMSNPWGWAAIHGAFIGALAIANLVSWRANDDLRRREQGAIEEALRFTERFRRAFTGAPNGTALLDETGRMLEINPALARAARTEPDALRDTPWWALLPEEDREAAQDAWPPEADGVEVERRLLRADGSEGWMLWKHSRLPEDNGQWIAMTTDISRRKEAEDKLAYRARHDVLTGLPNREAFSLMSQRILDERKPGEEVALMFADVDNFKVVNDSLGHAAGDELLISVTERMRSALRQDDVIGRFGGDEFVVCLGNTDATAAYAAAGRIASALAIPFMLGQVERFVTVSVGLVVTSDPEATVETLLRDSDVAMYEAKADGKDRCRLFGPAMRDEAMERLELEGELRNAVTNGEIQAHFQPQVRLSDGAIVGFEALARWKHPVRGWIPPSVFIPIAENSGLVGDISARVMRIACEHAAAWGREHPALAGLRVSSNASPRCLCNSDLPMVVGKVLLETGIDPARVCLEITESAIVDRGNKTGLVIQGLKDLGIRLSIDDFGVGESSLAQLTRLGALDEIKIDKSFIDDLHNREAITAAVVGAIIDVSTRSRMTVVAEGIEHASQAQTLQELGCQLAQGYYFHRPMPPEQLFEELLATTVG